MKRQDDYLARCEHLKDLSDEQLHERFWSLVDELTRPLLQAGRVHQPAIERSVLLRMAQLLRPRLSRTSASTRACSGTARHVVYRLSREKGLGIRGRARPHRGQTQGRGRGAVQGGVGMSYQLPEDQQIDVREVLRIWSTTARAAGVDLAPAGARPPYGALHLP